MPSFKGKDQNGNVVSSTQFKGKKLVIYFYPEDDTPTCTTQACNLRDNYQLLQNEGIELLGISPNTVDDHKKFEQKFDLPFTLVADPQHEIINKFGVWGLKNLYGREYMGLKRTTFLIDEKGIIIKVFLKPKSANHTAEILKAWNETAGN